MKSSILLSFLAIGLSGSNALGDSAKCKDYSAKYYQVSCKGHGFTGETLEAAV